MWALQITTHSPFIPTTHVIGFTSHLMNCTFVNCVTVALCLQKFSYLGHRVLFLQADKMKQSELSKGPTAFQENTSSPRWYLWMESGVVGWLNNTGLGWKGHHGIEKGSGSLETRGWCLSRKNKEGCWISPEGHNSASRATQWPNRYSLEDSSPVPQPAVVTKVPFHNSV